MAHSVTAATRNRLEVLPLELISMIFKNLGNDLVAHVTFSTLQPDIYDFCYKGLGPEFWRRILRASGISTLSRSVPGIEDWSLDIEDVGYEGPDKYETLARECVKHAENCSHPKCGMARIRANEELVRTRTERGASCMRTWDVSLDDDERGLQGGVLKMNSVWDGIVFKKHAGQLILRPRCTWPDVSFVRPYASVSADDDDTLQYGDELVQHPILWRSFASFPPVNKFGIMACGPDWIEPSNDRGVVVADVLQQILDADKSPPMNSADIAELIDRSRLKWSEKSDPWPVVPRNWDLSDTFNALQGIVDWLIIVRWTKLRIEELFDKQIACDMEFKAQKLPENYEDFERLTTLNY